MSAGTTRRTLRIDDALWSAAKAKAARLGVDLSTIQRGLLRGWVNQDDEQQGENNGTK